MPNDERSTHWDEVYERTHGDGVSWFQGEPTLSLTTILDVPGSPSSVVDIGGGASRLVDALLASGVEHVTVVDVSDQALALSRDRLGVSAGQVDWVVADIVEWQPSRAFDVWHDRAVFHFLTKADDRARYAQTAAASVRPGGHVVLATFAPQGPERCSNLPVMRYSADELCAELGPAFERVTAFDDVHITPSGAEQPFTWVVLRRKSDDA